jgi:hypothetical protein
MTGVVLVSPKNQFFDSAGAPLTGGTVTTYLAGTTTLATTYQDKTLLTANTNPITLNARGECSIWGSSSSTYKYVVKDSTGATIYTEDNIPGAADTDAAATAAAAAASGYAATAQSARDEAEAARDSLIAAAGVFASTVAGLAGTASGGYFWVPSAVAGESYILYLDNAGVAVEQFRMPSAAALTALSATVVSEADYAIQDGSDNAAMLVESGAFSFTSVNAEAVNDIPRYRLNKAARVAPNLTASYVHHISYGQSLALGNGSGGLHSLAAVDDGFFDCVMFNANGTTSAGPRAQEGSGTAAQNHSSFIPFVEQPVSGAAPSGNFETPLGNALRTVKRLLRDEDGIVSADYDYILIGSAPGQSNTAIAGLAQGQTPYANLIADVTYGLALAAAAGKSYAVDHVYFSQGERDIDLLTARATYKTALLTLYTNLNTDIKAVTGQTHNIKLVMYQCSTYNQTNANIALAQLDAAKENSSIILATAVYACEHIGATNVHLSALGYAHLGAYYGLAAKRVVVDQEAWADLYPTRLTRQGAILEIEFPDTGYPLAISDALFPTQTNAGFTAVRTDGTTNNVITSVTVVAPRRVRIVLTDSQAGYLRYGFATWGGNLHDTCDIDAGTAREAFLYRPCLTFEEAFA